MMVEKYKKRLSWRMSKWLQTPLAAHITQQEKVCLDALLKERLFAETIIVGEVGQEVFLDNLNFNCGAMVAEHEQKGLHPSSMIGKHEALPISSNTVDLVILPHSLEFTKRPLHILKEVDRCLKAESHLVIIGFNRLSLWGLRHFFSLPIRPPWCARFKSTWRLKEWLSLLNYEIVTCQKSIFTPPLKQRPFFKYFSFVTHLQQMLLPFSASVYVIVARKKIYGLTPLRPGWRRRRINGRVAKPVTRSVNFEAESEYE